MNHERCTGVQKYRRLKAGLSYYILYRDSVQLYNNNNNTNPYLYTLIRIYSNALPSVFSGSFQFESVHLRGPLMSDASQLLPLPT